jgi:myosin heavy subunit
VERPEQFEYLRQSGCIKIEGVNDGSDFEETLNALLRLGFSQGDIENLLRIIAGILHLGNIDFAEDGEGSVISNRAVCMRAALIFGLSPQELEHAFCTRIIEIRKEVQIVLLRVM